MAQPARAATGLHLGGAIEGSEPAGAGQAPGSQPLDYTAGGRVEVGRELQPLHGAWPVGSLTQYWRGQRRGKVLPRSMLGHRGIAGVLGQRRESSWVSSGAGRRQLCRPSRKTAGDAGRRRYGSHCRENRPAAAGQDCWLLRFNDRTGSFSPDSAGARSPEAPKNRFRGRATVLTPKQVESAGEWPRRERNFTTWSG